MAVITDMTLPFENLSLFWQSRRTVFVIYAVVPHHLPFYTYYQ